MRKAEELEKALTDAESQLQQYSEALEQANRQAELLAESLRNIRQTIDPLLWAIAHSHAHVFLSEDPSMAVRRRQERLDSLEARLEHMLQWSEMSASDVVSMQQDLREGEIPIRRSE
jgi:septation ring formation regulator EzrA